MSLARFWWAFGISEGVWTPQPSSPSVRHWLHPESMYDGSHSIRPYSPVWITITPDNHITTFCDLTFVQVCYEAPNGRSPAEIVGSNPTGDMDACLLWVLCAVEVSATCWSPVQRSPTDCGESLCVIYKPREWGGHGQVWALLRQKHTNSQTNKQTKTGLL